MRFTWNYRLCKLNWWERGKFGVGDGDKGCSTVALNQEA